jgi:very-short-patch-repair endonuclease
VAPAQRLGPRDSTPFDELSDLDLLLFRQDGVIGRAQALRFLPPEAVRHRLESGRWRLVHRAVYLTGGTSILTARQETWVALLAASTGRRAVVAGLSALQIVGLRGFKTSPVHVLIPGRLRDLDPPIFSVVHRTGSLPRHEVLLNAEPPCTAAGRSVVDAAQWAPSDTQAAGIVAAAFQQRLVTLKEIHATLARQPRAKRRALVSDVAGDAAGGSHSLPEIEFIRLCRRARLPTPTCQARRVDSLGRRRYLDAYFEEYGVHVEIDGDQHLEVRARWADMERQNNLWVAGDRVLRFPTWVVRHQPTEVATQVQAALQAAGWRR